MRNIKLFMISTILFSVFSCASHKPAFSGKAFEEKSSLEDTGFTKAGLEELSAYIHENAATTGMMILHEGKVMYKYGDVKKISYLASCRKSVLSMLYGKHVDNGTINLRETLASLEIDEDDGLLDKEKEATVNDIITSRSGVFHIPANGGYDERNILKRGTVEPGEYFVYNNWDFNVAGHILEQKTGNSVYQELEEQLAKPLGFQDWNIKNQKKTDRPKKSRYPAYHMYLSTRDMAKIGQLMLQEGEWEGKQLISKDWIRKTTSPFTPTDTVNKRAGRDSSSDIQFAYGYMWWLIDNFHGNPDFEGAYSATGYGGQFITVIPKRKLVIAHKTKLSLLTLAGITHKDTPDWKYWKIVEKLMGGE